MNTIRAHADSVFLLIREWQRGAMTWGECLRRCDVTALGADKLERITSTTSDVVVARLAYEAVLAGN